MDSLASKLTTLTEQAFSALGLPVEHARVAVSGQAESAQFQCNGAMPSAKAAKKNPRQIAEEVIAKLQELDSEGVFASLSVGGPGFINMVVKPSFAEAYLRDLLADAGQGVPVLSSGETVMLDYGGPNVAKAMHVGHLRSSIIGDALRRMMLATGYKAIGDVHLGDWGTPMGQIISELELRHPDWVYFDARFSGAYPKDSPVSMADLEEIYPLASKACKEDEARADKARQATADLQNGRAGYRALWHHFVYVSVTGMKKNFDALGVHFDLWKGEGSVHELIAPMVEKLKAQGLAREDDGALVIDVAFEGDKKEMPPLILYKRDGAVMYGTTDLATLVDRMQENKPSKIIYVVDQRQGLHFEQVFRAARKGGIVPESAELTHAGFGTMNGPDGKPFKTRAGGVMKLEDLIAMGVEKARERLKEAKLAEDMSAAEKEDIAHTVAIAAIKFADLQNNRVADYVFDLDRMTAFEGKTGPYLLYQAVRINSLLKKAAEQGFTPGETFVLPETDISLALILGELPDQIALALKNYTPHVLCDYAFKLAQAFSSFYGSCHILSEPDEALRGSRLALCALTARHLRVILSLLGIAIPERM
ncbi:MAG: arginine--tRNA ligase [Alphaproteobacteria bacterium]|nr:arginine--tRNA ligase [Alphaproteobacteria bacterium]MCB9975224.1 arginine--tRNA ligase [Rhodospirillales bacterium]